jgi:hypothetical protein
MPPAWLHALRPRVLAALRACGTLPNSRSLRRARMGVPTFMVVTKRLREGRRCSVSNRRGCDTTVLDRMKCTQCKCLPQKRTSPQRYMFHSCNSVTATARTTYDHRLRNLAAAAGPSAINNVALPRSTVATWKRKGHLACCFIGSLRAIGSRTPSE